MILTKPYRSARQLIPNDQKPVTIAYIFICICASLDNYNIGATLTALPSITKKLQVESTIATWAVSAYALTLASFIILAGKAGDIFGHEHVFIISSFLSGFFSLLSAVIPNSIIAVIVMRAMQGVFGAALIPCSFALAGNYFTGVKLQKAIVSLILGLTSMMGVSLLIGGAFGVSKIGYKGVFYLNFAMSWLCALVLLVICPDIPRTEAHKSLDVKKLDFPGCAGLISGLLLVILGLTEGGSSWRQAKAYVPLVVGAVLLVGVICYEMVYIQSFKDKYEGVEEHQNDWRVTTQLLFPREVLKISNFIPYAAGSFLCYLGFASLFAMMVEYYQYITLDSSVMIGLKTMAYSMGLFCGAVIYREWWAIKVGKKNLIVASALLQLTMAVWLSRLDFTVKHSYWKYECFSMFLMGLGCNMYFNVFFVELIAGSPLHLQGVVTGIVQTGSQIGVALGNALIATILGDLELTRDVQTRVEMSKRFQHGFYLLFASTGLTVIVLLFTKPKRSTLEEDETVDELKKEEEGVVETKELANSCSE
ncbi:hypothetical protein WICPIJ_003091 [Wickerhamomyces pijperi]|uniref:Major facilitator superfamily (MFS) profile domain-containing protein n=1 Tax=Wickerhamomyces pijperi TaxID=599730 RepID=A0A9P8Q7R2_WICPI|nr:hypothetical protein WICPIJ_003091 [Wickerhamomyces pijperi]